MEKYYDSIADGYDELYGEEQRKKIEIIKKNIEITADTKVLDIGCGSGISSDLGCRIVGIDPSEKLIEIARNRDKDKKNKYITAKAEDIKDMDFKDNEFDYAIAVSSMHHFDLSTLDQIKRVGKRFVFTLLKKGAKKEKTIKIIESNFKIIKIIEEEKDNILFLEK